MSRNRRRALIVCYDIRDTRRLRRIHRLMCQWGTPLQYSVFFCNLDDKDQRRMEADLLQRMDERVDDVRVYGVEPLEHAEFMGQRPFPDGVVLHV